MTIEYGGKKYELTGEHRRPRRGEPYIPTWGLTIFFAGTDHTDRFSREAIILEEVE